jgi:tRNA pseudouridine38/39 synthase
LATQQKDLPYGIMLNQFLPPDIRITHWAPVQRPFDARFSCSSRTYEYYFDSKGMDLHRMQEACGVFKGRHNFRNFCKRESDRKEESYTRRVTDCSVSLMYPGLNDYTMPECTWSVLRVTAPSFLWHQIRYMVSALFQVGLGTLSLSDLQRLLLGVPGGKRSLARAESLILTECSYGAADPRWISVPSCRTSVRPQVLPRRQVWA